MRDWFLRGAAFAFGAWVLYRLMTDPMRVIEPVIVAVVGLGVLMLIARQTQ